MKRRKLFQALLVLMLTVLCVTTALAEPKSMNIIDVIQSNDEVTVFFHQYDNSGKPFVSVDNKDYYYLCGNDTKTRASSFGSIAGDNIRVDYTIVYDYTITNNYDDINASIINFVKTLSNARVRLVMYADDILYTGTFTSDGSAKSLGMYGRGAVRKTAQTNKALTYALNDIASFNDFHSNQVFNAIILVSDKDASAQDTTVTSLIKKYHIPVYALTLGRGSFPNSTAYAEISGGRCFSGAYRTCNSELSQIDQDVKNTVFMKFNVPWKLVSTDTTQLTLQYKNGDKTLKCKEFTAVLSTDGVPTPTPKPTATPTASPVPFTPTPKPTKTPKPTNTPTPTPTPAPTFTMPPTPTPTPTPAPTPEPTPSPTANVVVQTIVTAVPPTATPAPTIPPTPTPEPTAVPTPEVTAAPTPEPTPAGFFDGLKAKAEDVLGPGNWWIALVVVVLLLAGIAALVVLLLLKNKKKKGTGSSLDMNRISFGSADDLGEGEETHYTPSNTHFGDDPEATTYTSSNDMGQPVDTCNEGGSDLEATQYIVNQPGAEQPVEQSGMEYAPYDGNQQDGAASTDAYGMNFEASVEDASQPAAEEPDFGDETMPMVKPQLMSEDEDVTVHIPKVQAGVNIVLTVTRDGQEEVYETRVTDTLTIGRMGKNGIAQTDIALQDSGASRKHLEISYDVNGLFVRDLGSANGTKLNGEEVHEDKVPLRDGDLIEIGYSQIKVQLSI